MYLRGVMKRTAHLKTTQLKPMWPPLLLSVAVLFFWWCPIFSLFFFLHGLFPILKKKQIVLLLLCSSTRIITSQSKEVNSTITTTATAAATLPDQQSYRLPKSKIYDVTRVCVVFNNKTKKTLGSSFFPCWWRGPVCVCLCALLFIGTARQNTEWQNKNKICMKPSSE